MANRHPARGCYQITSRGDPSRRDAGEPGSSAGLPGGAVVGGGARRGSRVAVGEAASTARCSALHPITSQTADLPSHRDLPYSRHTQAHCRSTDSTLGPRWRGRRYWITWFGAGWPISGTSWPGSRSCWSVRTRCCRNCRHWATPSGRGTLELECDAGSAELLGRDGRGRTGGSCQFRQRAWWLRTRTSVDRTHCSGESTADGSWPSPAWAAGRYAVVVKPIRGARP